MKQCSFSINVFLIRFPVFGLSFIFENIEVAAVARFADVVLRYGFQYGAAWFVPVGTVVETEHGGQLKHVWDIFRHCFFIYVERPEPLSLRVTIKITDSW